MVTEKINKFYPKTSLDQIGCHRWSEYNYGNSKHKKTKSIFCHDLVQPPIAGTLPTLVLQLLVCNF